MAALAVALGAFGAHGLEGKVSKYALDIYKTAVTYQFYHAIALCITGILYQNFPGKNLLWAGRLFTIGIFLFSFSLYVLSIIKGAVLSGYDWIGMITPFGGISFIAAWILIVVAVAKKDKPVSNY